MRRRRTPTLPRVTLDNGPTPQRVRHAPEGIETATGTRARRVRGPIDTARPHFPADLLEAALRFLRSRAVVATARAVTASYDGMPATGVAAGVAWGGVHDADRAVAAELAYVEAVIEPEFLMLLDLLDAGIEAHRANRPRTLAGIASTMLAYRCEKTALPAGIGMLWGALVRLKSIYARLQGRGRQLENLTRAATARRQVSRERESHW